MDENSIKKMYELLDKIPVTASNKAQLTRIKKFLDDKNFDDAIIELQNLKYGFALDISSKKQEVKSAKVPIKAEKPKSTRISKAKKSKKVKKDEPSESEDKENASEAFNLYPPELLDNRLEEIYIGLLLTDPRAISKFYFLYEDCYFANDEILSLYKLILFSDGEAYASEQAKAHFNFAKNVETIFPLKEQYKLAVRGRNYDFEKIYVALRKLFILRKNYLKIPIKTIQDRIVDIINYKLYDQMSIEEVQNAVVQAEVTSKFRRSILNDNLNHFLTSGENNLANGLSLPFPILSSVFKGIRKAETTSFAMPSNAGKSRFTINLAAHIAFVHHQKVLVISNEMTEDKMKLCLMTTVINNAKMQKLHGQVIKVSEGELLELKFRPDDKSSVKIDEEGYILRDKNESQEDYINKLKKYSSTFNKVLVVADWLDTQIDNSICFINITDHTNDELNKVIKNYYYKEHMGYIFYDTLKADTEHIGNGDEVKKTATILSNLAQDFNIFIGSTMQLAENATPPLNLDINDLSASRTVKEVLDTLCLVKQIHREAYDDYEYSLNEVDTEFFDLEKFEDPNVRYYACVVDKNRAGSKPKVLFRLNLAYNHWEELGYLRLKQ